MTASDRSRRLAWCLGTGLLLAGCAAGEGKLARQPPPAADPPAVNAPPPPQRAEKAIYCDPMVRPGHYLR
jgi:hypothetical protein